MTIEEIIDNRQKAEQEAINALIKAFNAMTEERNYYKDKVERIMDIPTTVGDSGTCDNKPIDVFDIKPAPSSADVNWNSINDTQSTSKLNWMHRETSTIDKKYYGD